MINSAVNIKHPPIAAFTLIELSIVLVIIGLIVGGILVGQDLITAASVRSQISQIEKIQTATNTFYGKYQALPGDIVSAAATQFGFAARGPFAGQGDGNGVIEGCYGNSANNNFGDQALSGEQAMFWSDLSYANGMNINLIDGSFSTATATTAPANNTTSATVFSRYLPQAKLGNGNYIYVLSGGPLRGSNPNNTNYLAVSAIDALSSPDFGLVTSHSNIPVRILYNIDRKTDDGLPQSGTVTANYSNATNNNNPTWAGTSTPGAPYTSATPGSATSCFDNGNSAGAVQQYSVTQNNGNGGNCAFMVKFK